MRTPRTATSRSSTDRTVAAAGRAVEEGQLAEPVAGPELVDDLAVDAARRRCRRGSRRRRRPAAPWVVRSTPGSSRTVSAWRATVRSSPFEHLEKSVDVPEEVDQLSLRRHGGQRIVRPCAGWPASSSSVAGSSSSPRCSSWRAPRPSAPAWPTASRWAGSATPTPTRPRPPRSWTRSSPPARPTSSWWSPPTTATWTRRPSNAAGLALTESLAAEEGVSGVTSHWSIGLGELSPLRSTDGSQALRDRLPGRGRRRAGRARRASCPRSTRATEDGLIGPGHRPG